VGFALAVTLDGKSCRVPAVADSPERLLPLSEGLELVNGSGGFEGKLLRTSRLEARLVLRGVADVRATRQRLVEHATELLGRGMDALEPNERRLDRALAFQLGGLEPGSVEATVYFDGADPQRADTLQRIVNAMAPRLRALSGVDADLELDRVVRERVQVRCAVHARLLGGGAGPDRLRLRANVEHGVRHLEFAHGAPQAASLQNQAVLGAVSRVALALGHDPRPVMSEGHAHAARFGSCAPLVRFERRKSFIVGSLVLPLALEPHGRQRAPEAEAALNLAQPEDANDLRLLAACVGLASQLPTVRAAIRAALQR
jgi:hypothetical protein